MKINFDQRWAELKASKHLDEQIDRLMKPLEMIVGTARCPSKDDVTREVITGILALEEHEGANVTHGMVAVRRNPASGYDLLLPATTVYDLHLRMEDNPARKDT